MLINGEKFACEACVRGHRVSSCHHQDRPLVHVNKKGRPVSQCQHCRGLRKARSQHVKCECHDKAHAKEDCPHDKGDAKAEPHTCCCQHGARCTCSVKKELGMVPEDIPQLIQPKEHHKHKPNMNSHDPKTTIFTNGHHKPVHKFNDAHNQLGAPYKIPSRSHSLHGHRESAQRSTDSLPLPKSTKPFHESPLHNSMTGAVEIQQRKVKSEHNSPVLAPQRMAVNPPTIQDLTMPPFDPQAYSYSPFGTDTPPTQTHSFQNSLNTSQQDLTLPEQFPESWFMTYEQAHEYDPPKYNDLSGLDWSSVGLDGSNTYSTSQTSSPFPSQQNPLPGFDLLSQIKRGGVTPSSGEGSEVDDQASPNRWPGDAVKVEQQSTLDPFNDLSSAAGDDGSDRYRLSSASSYYGTPQANVLASDNLGSLDIDSYLKHAEAETKRIQLLQQMAQMQMSTQDPQQSSRLSSVSRGLTPSISPPGSTPNVEHSYTISEAQKYAHMDGLSNRVLAQPNPSMPPAQMADDPSWSVAPDMSNPELSLDDAREDEDWVR